MLRLVLFLAALCLADTCLADSLEPSAYRTFTDKRDQQIEARIISISPDRKTMQMQRRDGYIFDSTITVLSLEDQQFIQQWLNPGAANHGATLRFFGGFLDGEDPKIEIAAGISDFTSLHAANSGWVAVLPSGETVARAESFHGLEQVSDFFANTSWFAITKRDGSLHDSRSNPLHPEILTGVKLGVAGSGHSAALLSDGRVKVWGRQYQKEGVIDAPGNLSSISQLATTQGLMAALREDGSVFGWKPSEFQVKSARPGDGLVAIEGSIFVFLGLTNSGEVYEWSKPDPGTAKIPNIVKDDGPFIKIRCNGNTRAVQREDGTWLAWGANGSGIVDHINQLGPTPDLAFFSVPSKEKPAYVIWIEPN